MPASALVKYEGLSNHGFQQDEDGGVSFFHLVSLSLAFFSCFDFEVIA